MAALAARAVTVISVLRQCSIGSLRALSVSSSGSTTAASGAGEKGEIKKKRRKKKNLFEVAQFLPNWGVGYQMAKNHWQGTSYKITKINLYKDGRHGKAWGIFYKDGLSSVEEPKKISGVHKRGWRYIPQPMKVQLTKHVPQLEGQSLA